MKRLLTFVANLLTAVAVAAPTANEDFVLAEDAQTYTNAVRAAKDYTDAAVAAATPADYANVSNRAMSAVQPAALGPYAKRDEIPSVPTKVSAFENDKGYLTENEVALDSSWMSGGVMYAYNSLNALYAQSSGHSQDSSVAASVPWDGVTDKPTFAKVATSGKYSDLSGRPTIPTTAADVNAYTKTQTDAAISSATSGLASVSSVASVSSALGDHIADDGNPHGVTAAQVGALTKAQGDAAYYPKSEGDLWAEWWSGDGFRVTVTNYNVAPSADVPWSRLPSAKFEYRPDGDATNELRVVWDEETKWRRWRGEFAAATNDFRAALDAKAGLDWGATTPTGFDAPAGFTWLDTPATVISGGLAWQKTLTSEGAFWVLSSNGMVAQFGAPGASTNGYFRITDERGNAVFEIVAGDKVTVGANAASVHTWQHTDGRTRIRVVYNVDSAEAPKLYAVQALNPGGTTDWKEVGTEGCAALAAGWTGQRGAWTNALWLATAPASAAENSLFVCATYERGGDTVVKNHAAVSMEKLVLGGKTYTIGTATVSGHTVLTLTEVP